MGKTPVKADEAGRPSLRERKKREAEQSIRDAARRLFVERGYDAVTVDDIATAADVSRTTFFNYFATKESPVAIPERAVVDDLRARLGVVPPDAPVWESFCEVFIQVLLSTQPNVIVQRHIVAADSTSSPLFLASFEWFMAEMRQWLQQRVPEGRARLMLHVAVAAVWAAFEQWDAEDAFGDFITGARDNLRALTSSFGSRRAASGSAPTPSPRISG